MILNTSAKNFTTWLRNRPLFEQKVDHPDGTLMLWVKPARVRNTSRGTQLVERLGEHWIRNPDPDGEPWRKERLGPVIWFDVLTLDDERIEVIGDCEATGAMLLYMTTLARIAETWSEARAEVLAYLEEMSEGHPTGIEWWDQQVNEVAKTLQAQLLAQQEAEGPEPQPDTPERAAEAEGKSKKRRDPGPYSGTNKDLERVAKRIVESNQGPKPACEYENIQYSTFKRWYDRAREARRLIENDMPLTVALERAKIPEATYKILEAVIDHLT